MPSQGISIKPDQTAGQPNSYSVMCVKLGGRVLENPASVAVDSVVGVHYCGWDQAEEHAGVPVLSMGNRR